MKNTDTKIKAFWTYFYTKINPHTHTHTHTYIYIYIYVTYWPPTQPSIGEQVHPVEDILTVDGLNWVQMQRSQEAGGCQTMI